MILGMYPLGPTIPPMTFNYHTSALLETSEGYILLEYGQYHKNNDGNDFYHYYYDDDGGVRFNQMSYDNFNRKSNGNIIPLNVENTKTLETLLEEVSDKMGLKFKDYNVGDNNCQDFMKNVIYVLCATRPKEERESHIIATLYIPLVILEKIESNEEYGCDNEGNEPDFPKEIRKKK